MSKRSKGDKRERQCKNLLKRAGWTVHKKTNNAYDNGDIWGLFDVIATKNNEKPLFIQVKSNGTDGILKELSHTDFLNLDHMDVQVWIAHDYQGWRIKKLDKENGWTQPMDERDNGRQFGEETVELYQQNT